MAINISDLYSLLWKRCAGRLGREAASQNKVCLFVGHPSVSTQTAIASIQLENAMFNVLKARRYKAYGVKQDMATQPLAGRIRLL